MSARIGFMVVLLGDGRWNDSWDGTIHVTREDTEREAAACRRAGYNPGIAQVNLIVSPEEVPHA